MSTEYEAGYNSPHIPCNHGDAQAIEYARLVAENAMPVEDEAEVLAAEMQEAMNEKSLIGCVQIAVKYADKRTAALQAELDRANVVLDAITEELSRGFSAFACVHISKILAERTQSPVTPRPAVVITDEHRQAYRRLRDHMGYPGAANDRKFIDALFAEPSS